MKHISSDLLRNTSLYRKVNYIDDRFPRIKIYGKCEQETTSGYNLYYINVEDRDHEYAGMHVISTHTGYALQGTSNGTIFYGVQSRYFTLPPGTYTFKLKKTSVTNIKLCDTSFHAYATIIAGENKTTFTLNKEANVMPGYQLTSGVVYNEYNEIMVYSGTDDKPFEPYTGCLPAPNPDYPMPIKTRTIGNIKLCGIGTDRDYAYKSSGKWFKHKAISNVVLDGSENWAKGSKQTRNRYYVNNLINTIWNNNGIDIISNYFVCITPNQSDADYIGLSKFNAAGFMINFDLNDENFDTVAKFKTWLSTHNTEVYYVLATPIEEEITDIPTINALEEIYANKIRERQEEIIVDEDID